MRLVTLDFETFYRKEDYTLSKMTTEEYLRDPRFEPVLLVAQADNGPVESAWGERDIRELLGDMGVHRKDTATAAHNARFDASIIEWNFGIPVNFVICSILMMRQTGISRLTGESLEAMADFFRAQGHPFPHKGTTVSLASGQHLEEMSDAFRRDYEVYGRLDNQLLRMGVELMLPEVSGEALEAMNMSIQMYTRPVFRLNQPLLQTYVKQLAEDQDKALTDMARRYGFKDADDLLGNLRSAPKFAKLLESLQVPGLEIPKKLSVKKSKAEGFNVYAYAFAKTDLEFIALLEHEDERVRELVQAKIDNGSSIHFTRAVRFEAISKRGTLPVPLQYANAHTGRYGGDDKINIQNLPSRGDDLTLRESIEAPEGFVVGGADSSQIEARLNAYFAQERALLAIFESGGCPYSYMAAQIYGESYDTVYYWAKGEGAALAKQHKDEPEHESVVTHKRYNRMRSVGKETILASGYQMSGAKFAIRLKQQGIVLEPTEEQIAEWHIAMRAKLMLESPTPEFIQAELDAWLAGFHEMECQRINRIYRRNHERIVHGWYTCQDILGRLVNNMSGYFGGPDGKLFFYGFKDVFGVRTPGIRLPDGYWILYPGLRETIDKETGRTQYIYMGKEGRNTVRKFIYGGKVVENIIQALAFALLKWQAIRIHRVLPVKINIHDEWASVFRRAQLAAAQALYEKWMTATPDWLPGVPIACEFAYGANYAEMK